MFSPYFKAFALSGRMGDINTKTQGDALGYALLPFQGVQVKSIPKLGYSFQGVPVKSIPELGYSFQGVQVKSIPELGYSFQGVLV